jgi:hypothetical protein
MFDRCKLGDYDQNAVINLFQEMGIKSLITKLPKTKEVVRAVAREKIEDENYQLVDSVEQLEDLVKLLDKQKAIAIDVETTVGGGTSWIVYCGWARPSFLHSGVSQNRVERLGRAQSHLRKPENRKMGE